MYNFHGSSSGASRRARVSYDTHVSTGGYEPNRSPLSSEAEAIILTELGRLADKVIGDVFESFSKHPKDVKVREEEAKKHKAQSGEKRDP